MTTHENNSVDLFYAKNATRYCATTGALAPSKRLETFVAALPGGARVLELGCGSGRDSAFLKACGIDVHVTDGVPEIAAAAQAFLGCPVEVLAFDAIDAVAAYDGVWASACLLHVPRADLPDILVRIHRALSPGGLFYASFKTGGEEGADALGRYFNQPDEPWLRAAYGPQWASLEIETTAGFGYDQQPTTWMHAWARRS